MMLGLVYERHTIEMIGSPAIDRAIHLALWRPLARGHPGQRQIGREQQPLDRHHQQAAAIDVGKHQLDHRHRHHGGEPDHGAPGGRQPQPDRRHQIDHGEIDRGGLPGHRLIFERVVLAADEAGDLGPVEKSLRDRKHRHHPQEQHQPPGPDVFLGFRMFGGDRRHRHRGVARIGLAGGGL
uniref:Delta-aminolevulinic acid dehydratase n=1 Tax=Rhodopseudomonas palustris (strain BisA53) TaxID=316055 RepID=Q07M89_RHOP5